MSLLLNKNCFLHELKNKVKTLIHKKSLLKQQIVLNIAFQRTLKSLFISEFQCSLKIFIYFRMST